LDIKNILLIEDNDNDVELTKRALTKSRIYNRLQVIGDGGEALKYFFGDDGKSGCLDNELPLVVLLDLNLPKVNGIEILSKMRAAEKTKLIPMVVLTSSGNEQDQISRDKLGEVSFIRKPVKFFEFTEAIRLLGLYLLVLNSQPLEAIY
jgi:two-component system response regulator